MRKCRIEFGVGRFGVDRLGMERFGVFAFTLGSWIGWVMVGVGRCDFGLGSLVFEGDHVAYRIIAACPCHRYRNGH